ncbi:MAG: YjbH domain-containing protein [Pseudomonadota bacterium]
MRQKYLFAPVAAGLTFVWTTVAAERPDLNTYGMPGVVELPSAVPLPDGNLSYSSAIALSNSRNTVSFQIFPRVTGAFRYTIFRDFVDRDNPLDSLFKGQVFDRGFDVQFALADQERVGVDLAVGLRDFLGTGRYSSEYIVATRSVGDAISLSFGIGWGRLSGRNSFDNPLGFISESFETRGQRDSGLGGEFEAAQWFRGDASFFAGVDWQLTEKASLQLEYSPDLYEPDLNLSEIDNVTPINVAVQYRFENDATLRGYVVGGEDVGVQFSFFVDPNRRVIPGGAEAGPAPIARGNPTAAASWADPESVKETLASRLKEDGLRFDSLDVNGQQATIYVENARWDVEAQAAGRAARAMAQTLPSSVQTFTVVFQEAGLPLSSVTTQRADLQTFQNDYDGAWRTLSRAQIEGTPTRGAAPGRLSYGISPYIATSYFDPQSPIRADIGAQADVSYHAAPGLTFAGRFRQPIAGNLSDSIRNSDSILPRVRSEAFLYAREADFEINRLTTEYLWRPDEDSFARVSAGYLENMFGGISAEVLFRPIESRFAWGVEVNYARQRDFDMLFGFQDYDVVTGHASAYMDMGNNYLARVDAGRYLAGDWGATFALDREFNNGVRVGGFFTLTDVPFDDFGEGSFDKGLTISFPLSYFTGQPSQLAVSETFRPILRDGGARLHVDNRLYELTRDYSGPELSDGWGRYLR